MNERQQQLLKEIVENHIAAAEPIGSKMLADKFDLSSATIRNEMAELEKMNMIKQPHTSAGRIPTEQGYRFYVNHYLHKDQSVDKKTHELLDQVVDFSQRSHEDVVKNLAKAIAEISHGAVFSGFGKFDMYYTGLSNLFVQPEFSEIKMIRDISSMIDHLDEVVAELIDQVEQENILIGSENPFGEDCSSIMFKLVHQDRPLLIGLLGPMRMDYQHNYALLKHVHSLIN